MAILFGLLFAVVGALGFRSSRRRVRTGQRTTLIELGVMALGVYQVVS